MDQNRYDWHIRECTRLQAAYSDAGVDFFVGIMNFEAEEAAWKAGVGGDTGWPTFLDCLYVTNKSQAHAYEKFKLMVDVCGSVEKLRYIGLDAAERLLHVPDDVPSNERPEVSAREAVMDEMVGYRLRNEKPAEDRHARAMQEKHFRPPPKNKGGPVNEFDRMKAEIRALKAENQALKAENQALKAENQALKAERGAPKRKRAIRARVACER